MLWEANKADTSEIVNSADDSSEHLGMGISLVLMMCVVSQVGFTESKICGRSCTLKLVCFVQPSLVTCEHLRADIVFSRLCTVHNCACMHSTVIVALCVDFHLREEALS